ncbi:GL19013 [Drosophila persimilis]|uniref:GL19013 n=1 Tax=Drosophila persimilis TaxID=7234 RepID=B4G767_DROPE|nr:GL19013 [Drosophila persimilis]
MKDIESFERSLRDFQYVENFRRFPFSPDIIKRTVNCTSRKQHKRFNPLFHLNEHQFRQKYRYTKENIRRIIEIVRDDLEIDCYEPMEREQVPIDLQILSAIRFWGGTELPQSLAEEHYNYAHSITYASARKCLNILMFRFGILGSEVFGSFGSAKQTITALAILHNMAMDWSDPSIATTLTATFFVTNSPLHSQLLQRKRKIIE